MGRASFKNPGWVAPVAVAISAILFAVAYQCRESEFWMPLSYIGLGLFALIAAVDSLSCYMRLTDTYLEFRVNFKRTIVQKAEIVKVTWESGCGVAVQLKDGSWVSLPYLGQDSLGVTNSVRAWLNMSMEVK